jgi:hypothetical protein
LNGRLGCLVGGFGNNGGSGLRLGLLSGSAFLFK